MANIPLPKTLEKYGLSAADWWEIWYQQGCHCAVCKLAPSTGRTVVDHDHVRGWKKMPPERRRLYVRGILCWFCNHSYLGRAITPQKARNVVAYLEAYEQRKATI